MSANLNRRLTIFVLAAAMIVCQCGSAAEILWSTNIEDALQRAAASGQPVLLEFTADWCKFCQKMEKNTFTNTHVSERISRDFVAVRVDADQNKDLVKDLGIKGLPAILIVSPDLKVIERISGFQTPEALIPKLDAVTAAYPTQATPATSVTSGNLPQRRSNRESQQEAVESESFFQTISREQELQDAEPAKSEFGVSQPAESGPAFDGFCVVSAMNERQLVTGTDLHQVSYRGQKLYFSSSENKTQFLASPATYWPMLDGACAMTLLEDQQRVAGHLEFAALFRKHIWLFASQEALQEFLLNPAVMADEASEINTQLER